MLPPQSSSYVGVDSVVSTASAQSLLPENREADSGNRGSGASIYRALNTGVVVAREFQTEGREIDMFSGGDVGILNEHGKEVCGRFTETVLDILLNVDDERRSHGGE